jgi:hypothetical protein
VTEPTEPTGPADPRTACYDHLEALEVLLSAEDYEPRTQAWERLEAILRHALALARAARRRGQAEPTPGEGVTDAERRHDAYQSERDAWEREAQRFLDEPTDPADPEDRDGD